MCSVTFRSSSPIVLLAALFASGCGSSSSSPAAPQTVTLTGLTLTTNTPAIGATVQATASATMSNGTSTPVTTGFGGDAPAVATVTASGSLTGLAIGDVTVFVDYQGIRASKRLRVLPGYGGIFQGSYTVDTCTDSGDVADAGLCSSSFTVGRSLPFGLNNTQSADLTSLVGQFAIGTIVGSGSGTVGTNGQATYAGAIFASTLKIELRNMTLTSNAAGHITGHFEQVWTDTTLSGSGTISCTIGDMIRTSGGLSVPAGQHASGGWRALLDAVTRR